MDSVQMQEAILQHWGIRGMKWGVRRYQNKDGSLTPEGRVRYGDGSEDSGGTKLTIKRRKGKTSSSTDESEETETIEQRREKLLKSSDAAELYKNRDLLTTAEINERLNRIDTERRLAKVMEETQPTKKTVLDKVDTVLKYGKKANEIYEFTNTPIMKSLKKKMGLATEEESDKSFNIKKLYENRDKLSDKDIQNAANRAENYNKLKRLYDDVTGETTSKAKNQNQATDNSNSKTSRNALKESIAKKSEEIVNANSKSSFDSFKESITKRSEEIANKKVSDAKSEVSDAVKNLSKSSTLKKAAAVEVAKEVGPELGEVISTFNDAMLAANQKKLDDYNKKK